LWRGKNGPLEKEKERKGAQSRKKRGTQKMITSLKKEGFLERGGSTIDEMSDRGIGRSMKRGGKTQE